MALVHDREELARRERRIVQLDLVCESLCERIVARERELERLRLELERALAKVERSDAELERAHASRARAGSPEIEDKLAALEARARAQATRIRLAALREAAEVSERITVLTRRPAESRERLLRSVNEAIARIGAEPLAAEGAERANGAGPDAAEGLFEGLVEVEVGPLADFSQLVGFEDAAGAITATSQISVKRFKQGRATLEVRLAEPVELLRELEERSPFEFRVRDQGSGRLVLDVDDE